MCRLLLSIVILLVLHTSNANGKRSLRNKHEEKKPLVVSVIGDSLMERPMREFNLFHKIKKYAGGDINFECFAQGGTMIKGIKENQLKPALESLHERSDIQHTRVVLMLWDTDISDVDESGKSDHDVASLRQDYKKNLRFVIEGVQKSGAHLIMGGPILLGEQAAKEETPGPKEKMLDDYREINMDVAKHYGVKYVDLRKSYKDKLPDNCNENSGKLTLDGEHPNNNGAELTAKGFGDALKKYMH